ncbi:MAG: 1,4-dihydroxy-2-naphthoate octaprenyltransferase [Bacteroidia bacterium]|nr:1,4-dihydroxy-2-naphthoate octaprenyltransferase [Bacteroidia bacterium]
MPQTNVTKFANWWSAFRFRTLFLSFSCIGAGLIEAWLTQGLDYLISLLTLLTALFLQVLSNLANDYGDSIHGADGKQRKGPARAVSSGAISASAMKKGMIVCALLAFVSGLALLYVSLPVIGMSALLLMLALGISGIAAAILYTNGKRPYGYTGLGDISVFLFFGLVAVQGTAFLQSGTWLHDGIYLAIAFGLLSVGVLNVNNMRDIHSDAQAGKKSIPVRIGLNLARIYHFGVVLIGLLNGLYYAQIKGLNSYFLLLPFALFAIHLFKIFKAETESDFDPQLKVLSLSTFALMLCLIVIVYLQA